MHKTHEVKCLQESRAKDGEEMESLSTQVCKLDSDNKYLKRQVQIMIGGIQKQNKQIKALDKVNIQ